MNDAGASASDPKDVSTFSHMFGCWETLYAMKQAIEKSGYRDPTPQGLPRAHRIPRDGEELRRGPASIRRARSCSTGACTSATATSTYRKVEKRRLRVVHRTRIEDGLYEPEGDYTKQPL